MTTVFYRYVLVCFTLVVYILGDFYELLLPLVAMERIQCMSESVRFFFTQTVIGLLYIRRDASNEVEILPLSLTDNSC